MFHQCSQRDSTCIVRVNSHTGTSAEAACSTVHSAPSHVTYLDDVSAVVVEGPQLAVVPLVRPPEGVLPQHLVLLELRTQPPALVVCQCVPIFLHGKQQGQC